MKVEILKPKAYCAGVSNAIKLAYKAREENQNQKVYVLGMLVHNNFVVEGIKTISSAPSEVFDNYNVNYSENTADKTASNTANWEYVAQSILTGKTGAAEQTIKYWDFAAKQ